MIIAANSRTSPALFQLAAPVETTAEGPPQMKTNDGLRIAVRPHPNLMAFSFREHLPRHQIQGFFFLFFVIYIYIYFFFSPSNKSLMRKSPN